MDSTIKTVKYVKKVFLLGFFSSIFFVFYFVYFEGLIKRYYDKVVEERDRKMMAVLEEKVKDFKENIRKKEYREKLIKGEIRMPEGCSTSMAGIRFSTTYIVECSIKDADGKLYTVSCYYAPIWDNLWCVP